MLSALASVLCAQRQDRQTEVSVPVQLRVSDQHIIGTPPAGFASFTLDFHPASLGKVWGKNASILEIDLHSPGLVGVARALAPAILRLGGSEAGQNLTYTGFPGDDTPCPIIRGAPYYYCLSRERWDEILEFANATGSRLMLDLNIIGPGNSSDFDATLAQIDALFAHTCRTARRADAGGGLWAFELGNENQGMISPEVAAKRVQAVAKSLARHWPSRATRPLLVGPSPHISPDWIVDFLAALHSLDAPSAEHSLDVFAYHMYSGYGKAPGIAEQIPTPGFLDDARDLVDLATGLLRSSALAATPIMVSETAAAWSSGGPTGACLAFASSFWYFDHLATAASSFGGGHLAVARQTLVGGNYSLVDSNDGFRANPDFFVALLWRQVVEGGGGRGARVLRSEPRKAVVSQNVHREIRCFSACDASGRLIVGVANLGGRAASVEIQNLGFSSAAVREQWVLEAAESDLLTRKAKLNGLPLESVGGIVPPLPPVAGNATELFLAPPQSVAFLRYEFFPLVCKD